MNALKSNIEAVARNICALQLGQTGILPDELRSTVDRFWPCVAAEIEAGLIDESGNVLPHDLERGLEAYRDWCRRHPTNRAR
jgi:hypothetical protein